MTTSASSLHHAAPVAATVSPLMRVNGNAHAENTIDLDSVEGIEAFKWGVTVAILLITVVAALVPLWISQNGNSRARQMLTQKLPFLTAGVFVGSGLMHLLPDAVKMYNKALLSSPHALGAQWMKEFPLMYLLSALGCMIVWAVDLINLGDSPKMMAVASAARPNHESSMYRLQVPRVASFTCARNRTRSADDHTMSGSHGKAHDECHQVLWPTSPPLRRVIAHPTTNATAEESRSLLTPRGMKMYSESSIRTYTFDHQHHGHAHPHRAGPQTAAAPGGNAIGYDEPIVVVDDEDLDLHNLMTEATLSEHVVFSGESPFLPYLLAALFSIHSLIAGFALGVNRTSNKTAIATAIAIFSHKVIEAMSVGANFARAKESIAQERSVAVLTLYSFMTPLGIVLGMWLSSALQGTAVLVAESVALSVASGSFVYLAFHEMSDDHHGTHDVPAGEKILLFGSGIFSMAALATWA